MNLYILVACFPQYGLEYSVGLVFNWHKYMSSSREEAVTRSQSRQGGIMMNIYKYIQELLHDGHCQVTQRLFLFLTSVLFVLLTDCFQTATCNTGKQHLRLC